MNNDWEFDYQGQYQRSYTQPVPEMQPTAYNEKRGGAKKFFKSLGIVALCGIVGFGGGVAGSLLTKNGGTSVIYQAVDSGKNQGSPTSTGTALTTAEIVNKTAPSVVEITTEHVQTDNLLFGQRIISGAGSGVIITEDGYIVTNNHIVEGANSVKVRLNDQTEYDAEVIGADSRTDIALIKINANGLTPAVIGNSDNVNVGEFVIAIGNPLGQYGGTVTNGIISALNRDVIVEGQEMTLLQTNAAVSPGNSGGGLFNERGELIAIVNSKSNRAESEGIGFAIPVNTAMEVALSLKDNGYVSGRPAIGVGVITINDVQTAMAYGVNSLGVYIQTVTAGGPAEKAGIKPADRIAGIDSVAVSVQNDLFAVLKDKKVGDTVNLQIERERQLLSIDVVLGEMGKE